MAIGVNNNGWWGEGEVKFFMDGDTEFPTYLRHRHRGLLRRRLGFRAARAAQYCIFSTPFLGLPQVIKPDGFTAANTRFGMYRWHIMDPIRFESDLRVTIQDLGWRSARRQGRYLPRQDDIATTSFWYQTEPHAPFPPCLTRTTLKSSK